MPYVGNVLFNGSDAFAFEGNIIGQVPQEVDKLPESDIRNKTPDEIADALLSSFPKQITIDFNDSEKVIESAMVPKPRDLYFGSNSTGYTDGIRHGLKFKFSGWPSYFYMKPSNYGMNASHGLIDNGTITVGIDVHPSNQDHVDQYVNDQVSALKQHLSSLSRDLNESIVKIRDEIHRNVQRRTRYIAELDKAKAKG